MCSNQDSLIAKRATSYCGFLPFRFQLFYSWSWECLEVAQVYWSFIDDLLMLIYLDGAGMQLNITMIPLPQHVAYGSSAQKRMHTLGLPNDNAVQMDRKGLCCTPRIIQSGCGSKADTVL